MKYKRSDVQGKALKIPDVRFEPHTLTSFGGLIVFQKFFATIDLKARLARCFNEAACARAYRPHVLMLYLVVHILIGCRRLREMDPHRDDPLVQRILGLKKLPNVATVSRFLKDATDANVENLRGFLREMVLERLVILHAARITLDFDGSVQSTMRFAEGAAVGFNKQKKGARSYYPLFCTVAQTGQVLDLLHRSGNVHDSNGARQFILSCIAAVRDVLPHAQIEVRMDSAFFSDSIITMLDQQDVQFTLSVPFERFTKLKSMIEDRKRWHRLNGQVSYFETGWKPDAWDQRYRFLFIRTKTRKQRKEPVQLDLFIPHEHGYEFKVIVTNKTIGARKVAAYHDGRGAQENVFGELKSQCQMDYVPVRRRTGNQLYLLATLLAHNLTRELQMATTPPARQTTEKRAALWAFQKLDTLRRLFIQRAGRLTRPEGRLTLTLGANQPTENYLQQTLQQLDQLNKAA